jgi:hypothetical protein
LTGCTPRSIIRLVKRDGDGREYKVKYRVYRGSNAVTKAVSKERAERLAAKYAAKSPHIEFTVRGA